MKKTIQIILVILIGLFLVFFITDELSQRNREEKQEVINAQAERIRIIDSLQTIYKFSEIVKLDSLKKDFKLRQDIAGIETRYWKSEAERQKKSAIRAQLRADSLASTKPECSDIAEAYIQVIDTLKEENNSLSLQAESLTLESSLCSKTLAITEKQLNLTHSIVLMKDSTIQKQQFLNESLIKELNRQQNWWNRNKFWVGGGMGVAVSVGGLLMLLN